MLSAGKTSICNIVGTCVGFTDLRGQVIAPFYLTSTATSVSNPNPSPLTYNTLLNSVARQQTTGFWSAEQDISNLVAGHYQTWSATANKRFDDIDVRLMGAYRTFDNSGNAVSRGQPLETNTYIYRFPKYESWQSELTVNGKALAGKLQWTTGLFYFNERSPNDGGQLYLFLPSAGSAPTAAAGKQLTVTDWSNNSEENSSYAAYAQATYSIWSDTRLTAGVRYTYDERFAHIATPHHPHPRDHRDQQRGGERRVRSGRLHLRRHHLCRHHHLLRPDQCQWRDPAAVGLPFRSQPQLPQADLDPGAGSRPVGRHHGLCHHALGLSGRRHQYPGGQSRRDRGPARTGAGL